MTTLNSLGRSSSKRRTSRLVLMAKIGVTGTDRLGQKFTVGGKATSLNHHGAALSLSYHMPIGAVVTIRNAHNAEATARIVSHLSAHAGTHTYGVEFVADAAGFWGIHFPSASS